MPDAVHAEVVGVPVLLGKLKVKKDKRNLKLASYLEKPKALLPSLPSKVLTFEKVPTWPMYDNDSLSDCTAATCGHLVQAWTNARDGKIVTPKLTAVDALYWATGSEDDGRYSLDVLNEWHKNGMGGDKIGAFVQLNLKLVGHWKYAISEFGGAFVGVELPIAAQRATSWKAWTGSKATPGSWGGHAISAVGYDQYGAYLVTWGAIIKASWGFMTKYADEGYAIISPDYLKGGKSPQGFDMTKLSSDLGAIESLGG